MKKTLLFLAFGVSAIVSNGQLTLTGTSYSQNFDGIGTGLGAIPGWYVFSGASTTYLGSVAGFSGSKYPPSLLRPDTASCIGSVNVGGFKNFPSATVAHPGDDNCATPSPADGYTNRALGVRQVSPTNVANPNLDSGASFVLNLANTAGFYGFHLDFKLQSLDTASPRVTTWLVDYGIGATPTVFTPATSTTGIWTTGGNTFSNNTVTVDFHHALDNLSTPVYIRITTLVYSAGSGARASSAIDDFNLYWSPSTTGVNTVTGSASNALSVMGNATSGKIALAFSAENAGDYTLAIYDLTGRILHTENVAAQAGTQQVSVDGLHLASGMYFAKMYNGATSVVARVMIP